MPTPSSVAIRMVLPLPLLHLKLKKSQALAQHWPSSPPIKPAPQAKLGTTVRSSRNLANLTSDSEEWDKCSLKPFLWKYHEISTVLK